MDCVGSDVLHFPVPFPSVSVRASEWANKSVSSPTVSSFDPVAPPAGWGCFIHFIHSQSLGREKWSRPSRGRQRLLSHLSSPVLSFSSSPHQLVQRWAEVGGALQLLRGGVQASGGHSSSQCQSSLLKKLEHQVTAYLNIVNHLHLQVTHLQPAGRRRVHTADSFL